MQSLFQKQVALPSEHGAWVFLLSPLIIGLVAGKATGPGALALVVAAVSAFLLRQPISMAVKVHSGRRRAAYLSPSIFWTIVYGLIAIFATLVLVNFGHAPVLYLALPAVPVMAWHLWLVSRRAERRQPLIEIMAAGALALSAPAALWVGRDDQNALGWWIWILVWLQSGASILYAYARLAQREAGAPISAVALRSAASPALAFAAVNVLSALVAGAAEAPLRFVFVAYVLQLAEVIWGTVHPAVGWKPARVGVRQLILSTMWTVLFIIALEAGAV